MILTDREIRHSIDTGSLSISPMPGDEAFAPTTVDLTLHDRLKVFRPAAPGDDAPLDPAGPGYVFAEVVETIAEDVEIGEAGFVLAPQQLVLAWTRERVLILPSGRVVGRLEGKSALARLGLAVHVTAPTIHAGSSGQIQLEIVNHGPRPILMRAGMRVCQIMFEQTLGVPEKGYGGQFRGQRA